LKLLLIILIALNTLSAKAFSDCGIDKYFAQPTPKGERSIIIQGSTCHSELIEFFKSSEQEDQRYNALEIIIAATNITPEIDAILTEIITSEKTGVHEKGLLEFYQLSTDPENLDLLKKVVNYLFQGQPHNMDKLRFWLFHARGLEVLEAVMGEAVIARNDMIETTSLTIKRHFPNNTDEILLPSIKDLYEYAKQAEREDALETVLEVTALLELISYKQAIAFQQKVLSEVDDYPLDLANSLRMILVSIPLKGSGFMPKGFSKQLSAFYLNKYTAPQGKGESDEEFMNRRYRLLNFSSYLKGLLIRDSYSSQQVELIIRDNLIQIFSTDMEEFAMSMINVIRKLDPIGANRIISKLISTNKVLPVTRAFQLIRRMPSDHWQNSTNETENFKNLARFHSMQVTQQANNRTNPEKLRLEAAATLLYLTNDRGSNLSTILSGLRDTNPDVRQTTLRLANEQYCSDPLIAHALVMVLRHDPSLNVRTEALRLISAQIETAKEERRSHPLLDSSKVGIAILYSWNETDQDLLDAAEGALSLYVQNSRHAKSLLLQGAKSSNKKMLAAVRSELENIIKENLSQSLNLMAAHSKNNPDPKYSLEFLKSIKSELDRDFIRDGDEK